MGKKEQFEQAVEHAPSEEEQIKHAQHQENADPLSHLKPGGRFDPKNAEREQKQTLRRAEGLRQLAQNLTRVQAPAGDCILSVTWKEHLVLRQDPEFVPFSKYASNLLYYADGALRPRPVRPLIQNEVGTYRGKIVALKDMGPDDIGGKFFSGFDIGQETKQEKELK
jgi:hypothetical protein